MKIILIYFITLWMLACSTAAKKASREDRIASIKYNSEFQKALSFMEDQQFDLATQGFQSILDERIPEGSFKWSILFNIGVSYLLNKDCPKAKKNLQDLASQTNPQYKFRGQILLQLHYAHECLGETHQALAVLNNTKKERPQFSEEEQWIEIPSRYSILHASLGNKKKALMYQNKALQGLKKLKQPIKNKKVLNKMAAKNFYIMGRSFVQASYINLDHFLNALPYHQIYLAQSFLISESTWTDLARKEINELYKKVFIAYNKIPFNKKSLYKSHLMKALNDFRKIANESHNRDLKKTLSHIVQQSQTAVQ